MSFRVLDAFVDAGFDCIDTANAYSTWVHGHVGGESETIIGKWMKARGNRGKVTIATKVGAPMGTNGDGGKGLSKAQIIKQCDDSLKRLQTDVIDLYQSHYDDETVPIEETLSAYADLIKAGKVRAIGASNFAPARLAQSLQVAERTGLPRYETLQPKYNLVDRAEYEAEREPICVKHGLGVIPYYPLAAGFLTGKYRTQNDLGQSLRGAFRIKDYLNERGLRVLKGLDEVAARRGVKPGQVAIAWVMARPNITAPIASA